MRSPVRRGFHLRVWAAMVLLLASAPQAAAHADDGRPGGVDVASYQPGFDWPAAAGQGISFAYVKATQGVTYRNPLFAEQYNGAYQAGMIRGAYHYARPDRSGGAAQAEYFVQNGGGWSRDARTLPGALDLENTAGTDFCYGRTTTEMRDWVRDFVNRYHDLTGRWAVLYTRTSWWDPCLGQDGSFAANSPLWLAHPGTTPGPIPAGWGTYSFWQRGLWNGVDFDTWNGSYEQLRVLACDGPC
jgi:GH25 family lysozyme M1 (1,4-beta-N-acetylmuramidase)